MRTLNLLLLLLTAQFMRAQVMPNQPEPAYIEVTGSAEVEIVPDEIYITVTLSERFDGREKISLATQDEKFFKAINELSIPVSDVQLSNAVSDFNDYKWRKEDALATKAYLVLVHDAGKTSELFRKMVDIDAENATITRVSHSKIESFRKEVKINAMKATYEKANYMLNAIGHQAGNPMIIREVDESTPMSNVYSQYSLNEYSGSRFLDKYYEAMPGGVTFEKIKIRYAVYGKFEIK